MVDMLMWGLDPVAVLESERLKTTVLGAPVQGQGVGKGVWHGGEALEATGFCPSSRISLVDGHAKTVEQAESRSPRSPLWGHRRAGLSELFIQSFKSVSFEFVLAGHKQW